MFFFKLKSAYGLRISGWSSDVCSSDLEVAGRIGRLFGRRSGRSMALHPDRGAFDEAFHTGPPRGVERGDRAFDIDLRVRLRRVRGAAEIGSKMKDCVDALQIGRAHV